LFEWKFSFHFCVLLNMCGNKIVHPIATRTDKTTMSASPQTLRIQSHLPVQPLSKGAGFRALGIRGDSAVMDPYLMVDHYWMSQPTFGPHPHAGFSAVTYMFDDAETGFNNRDSMGDHSHIRPGDLHWTIAGAGVVHDEVPVEPGRTAHGLQIFVNLAAAKKHMAPTAHHIAAERMPVVQQRGGARVKVAFGAYDDGHVTAAPVEVMPADAALLDINVPSGQSFAYPVPEGHSATLMVIAGTVQVAGQALKEGQAVSFARDGGVLDMQATTDSHVALLLGRPLNEPVVRHGPFAMTTQADIERAISDFQAGRMGHL
jgi:redox-sensitive bicupin YhaK (pirin superfamily)